MRLNASILQATVFMDDQTISSIHIILPVLNKKSNKKSRKHLIANDKALLNVIILLNY